MTVLIGECSVCPRNSTVGSGTPVGIDCPCGRHFHVGDDWLIGTMPCECPSCGREISPLELRDPPVSEDQEALDV